MMATQCDFKNALHLTVGAKWAPRTILGTGLGVPAADGDTDKRTRAGVDSFPGRSERVGTGHESDLASSRRITVQAECRSLLTWDI